jgi:glycosyltransferase involved in cell wall biosynthesis
MATLCFITTCMGRLSALRQTLGRMAAQPGCSCVVVDYSCTERSGDWVEAHHPDARVVRVPGQTEFRLAAARNAGARAADAPWLCFVDADVLLEPGFAAALAPALAPGAYYRAAPGDAGLGGTFACARADFDRAGGYDEVYRGWGEEDNDLYDALQFLGLDPRPLPTPLMTHLAHGDDERTRFYPVADRALGHAVNRVYRVLKWDTARLRRELLTPEMRRAMYDRVAEVVTASLRAGRPGDLAVHLPAGIVPGGWSLSRSVTYRLAKEG